ncbi:MAG: single-stranded DNA-binding protein [Bdellovibrionales bacterium]|nr:single-stranded DNA-binding protein [Bdellovibrionales bacterium]
MNSINNVFLTGYLGDDPQIRESKSGYSYLELNLATHHSRRKKDMEWENQTHWHRILVFGKLADYCRPYLRRGSPIAVEGSLSSLDIKTSSGQSVRQVKILANKIEFLSSKESRMKKEKDNNLILSKEPKAPSSRPCPSLTDSTASLSEVVDEPEDNSTPIEPLALS